jgi:LPXTG-site transpeptidase (sortase) family protein
MELDPTSDAIDNGDDTICNAAPVNSEDQRSITRPQGNACDIGAFEVDGPPDVTVEQASGQTDPTNTSPIKFTATFDEPIDTATFTDADLSYSGSTAPGTYSATITEVAPNDGTTFEVEVSGMTSSGDVVLSIEAGKVQDPGGNDNNASTSTDNTVAYEIDAPIVLTTSLQAAYTNTGPSTFTVTFSEDVNDAGGGTNTDDATYLDNYLVVEDGPDGSFQTSDCLSGLAGDDTQATVTSVSLFNPPPTAAVTLSAPLGIGNYRLFVCGTTSITDIAGNHLNSGVDFTFDFTVSASTGTPGGTGSGTTISASALPITGFAPKQVTTLPPQPADLAYAKLGDLWLEMPSLHVKTTIVGVPRTGEDWELSWLGNDTGWLNGSAFPTWNGNSVLTAHVTNASGLPGPFAELGKLNYGDQVIVHMGGMKYIYEVRASRLARPYSTSFAFESLQDHSYLTLITCQFYNPLSDNYVFRRVVRAVLVRVESE